MRTLLIDNSNGRTKFALSESGVLLSEVQSLPTAALTPTLRLPETWHYDRVCLCSVVPAAAKILRRRLGRVTMLTPENCKAVDFSGYAGIATLGADRVADCLAVAAELTHPTLVIDAGTAVTVDLLLPGAKPRFMGGSILPGLSVWGSALHHATAQLPPITLDLLPRVAGQTTTEALQSGAVWGFIGAVREVVERLSAECGEEPHVVATGGDAELLAAHIPQIARTDALLTLRGIARFAELCC